MRLLRAGLALIVISLLFLVKIIIYSSPLREFFANKCCKSWIEPPELEKKLTNMTTTVGEGLKRRITFKIKEEEMAKQQQDQGGNGPSIVSMVNN
jgi:hypothetical protein